MERPCRPCGPSSSFDFCSCIRVRCFAIPENLRSFCLCSISSATSSEYTATPEQLATLSRMLTSMSSRPTPAATPGANVFGLTHLPVTYSKNKHRGVSHRHPHPREPRAFIQQSSGIDSGSVPASPSRSASTPFRRRSSANYSVRFQCLIVAALVKHALSSESRPLNSVRPNLEQLFRTLTRPFEPVSSVVSYGLLVSQKKLGLE